MRLGLWLVVALAAFVGAGVAPGLALGQTPLPWASSARPAAPADVLTETQLPLARMRLEGGSARWVGQAVPVVVEVIVPSWFTGAPEFPDLEVPKAVTLSPEPVWNFTVQAGRQSFPGQARRYLVFPQAEGRYQVPPIRVGVSYALPGGGTSAQVALPAAGKVAFEARLPAGARDARYFLTTDGFRLSQSLDRKPGEMRVGDALTRTIRMTALDTVGSSIPQIQFEAPEGIRVYPATPAVAETAERGTVQATRTERVAYVTEKAGRYTLPEIVVLWWNPKTKAMSRATAPAVTIDVRDTAAYGTEVFASSQAKTEGPPDVRPDWRRVVAPTLRWTILAVAIVLPLLVVRRLLQRNRASRSTWLSGLRKRRAEAEGTWYRRFRRATLSGGPRASLRSVMSWLDRADTRPLVPTLTRFAAESHVPGLSDEVKTLNGLLFAASAGVGPADRARATAAHPWSGWRFLRVVGRARRSRLAATRHASASAHRAGHAAHSALPPQLNPEPTSRQ